MNADIIALFAEHGQSRVVDHGNTPGRVADHKPKRQAGHHFCGHGLLVAQNTPPTARVVHPEQRDKSRQSQRCRQRGRKQVGAGILCQSIL